MSLRAVAARAKQEFFRRRLSPSGSVSWNAG